MVSYPAERKALAREHVIKGRNVVAGQRALITRMRAQGRDWEDAERLLGQFEASLAIFEQDLARLTAEDAVADLTAFIR